jgi:hypothetical protein
MSSAAGTVPVVATAPRVRSVPPGGWRLGHDDRTHVSSGLEIDERRLWDRSCLEQFVHFRQQQEDVVACLALRSMKPLSRRDVLASEIRARAWVRRSKNILLGNVLTSLRDPVLQML